MKISDILKKRMTFSLEVFPPKDDKSLKPLKNTLEHLYVFSPDFISCTYGAGGTNKGRSTEVCQMIMDGDNLVMPHFTCIGNSREMVKENIADYVDMGIKNFLLLRGDLPEGWTDTRGDFTNASELIELVKKSYPEMSFAAAAYPEIHVESDCIEDDIKYLKLKQDLGADFFITQLCHDADIYFQFIDNIRKAGITIPVVAGVMPILSRKGTIRMSDMNGVSIPDSLLEIINKYENNSDDFSESGKEYTVRLINKLLGIGIDGLHLYTLNKHKDITDIINMSDLKV